MQWLVVVLLLTGLVLLRLPGTTARGHLPKSRTQLRQEAEARQRARQQAQLEAEKARQREEALEQAREERARKWREERQRLRDEYLARKRAEDEAERRVKEAQQRKLEAEQRKIQQQQEQQRKEAEAEEAREEAEEEKREGTIAGGQLDCHGVPGGLAVVDACGVCGGDDTSCADCAGVPNGNSSEDCAGVCQGTDFSCVDCAGVMNGNSRRDPCGVCNGDGQSCLDCRGTVNGNATYDVCGVCGGDGTSCLDCKGVANGLAKIDPCGICEGDGTSCCSPVVAAAMKDVNHENDAWVRNSMPFDTQAPVLCSGHGHCASEHRCCVCDQGWTGPFCSIRQNLCFQNIPDPNTDPEGRQYCNGRGVCVPDTGYCRCDDTEAWMGLRCEVSRCNHRGAYDMTWGYCHCDHGYGGQFCELCVSAHPRPGVIHVCMENLDAWQEVPEDLRLERSILLDEKNPHAPVFQLEGVYQELVDSYINGHSYMNLGHRNRLPDGRLAPIQDQTPQRDFIWPNSTHAASGYYYDCGCRLAAPPPDLDGGKVREARARRGLPTSRNSTSAAAAAVLDPVHRVGRPYHPHFTNLGLHTRTDSERSQPIHVRQNNENRRRRQAEKERSIHQRSTVTLSQCEALLQQVLDEFGYNIDAATAQSTELSTAIGAVHDTCGSEASFGFSWFLLAMGVAIFVAAFVVLCIMATNRFVQFREAAI